MDRARRKGFKKIRDIITAHRRAWTADYLEQTLRREWEEPLREIARQVNTSVASRGKLPTVTQLANLGERVANTWFGGDLSALYIAIGEKTPIDHVPVRMLHYDRAAFCNQVFDALGGRWKGERPWEGNEKIRHAAATAVEFIQQEKLLGRPPTASEVEFGGHNWPPELTFEQYAAIITKVRASRRWPGL